MVHLPTHASWLNQVEIYFSILQRKALTPTTSNNIALLARTLNEFERHWSEVAEPFKWNFTDFQFARTSANAEQAYDDLGEDGRRTAWWLLLTGHFAQPAPRLAEEVFGYLTWVPASRGNAIGPPAERFEIPLGTRHF